MFLDANTFTMMDDTEKAFVDVPEYQQPGQDVPQVRVRSLTTDQRQRLFFISRQEREKGIMIPNGINARCCAMGMIGQNSLLLFENEETGSAVMGKRHPEIVARIANRIYELSDMTKVQREEAEKKLLTTSTNSSASGSAPV